MPYRSVRQNDSGRLLLAIALLHAGGIALGFGIGRIWES
jgi:hypothetical protein